MNRTKFISSEDLKPKRKTKGSAGYDFVAPNDIIIPALWKTEFDTGVAAEVEEGYVLLLFIRSSLGSTLWALLGTLATIFVQGATNIFLEPLGLPALTAPFCLTTWLFLLPRIAIGSHRTATPSSPPDHSNWHKPKAESRA